MVKRRDSFSGRSRGTAGGTARHAFLADKGIGPEIALEEEAEWAQYEDVLNKT